MDVTEVDCTTPNAARIYDYDLGGEHNFAADRAASEEIQRTVAPTGPFIARANRAFLQRAVRFCLDQGIDQFLDLGSGIPTVGNVHEIAQDRQPGARVLYVDVEPVAVATTRHLLEGNDHAGVVHADVRDPDAVLDSPEAASLLDFSRPVALLTVAVLHYITPQEQTRMHRYREVLAPGSAVVISTLTADERAEEAERVERFFAENADTQVTFRTRDEVLALFDGTELVSPGVVWTPQWRPDPADPAGWEPHRAGCWAGVGLVREP
ncbi:S-adenosyl methyltransferase [Saccharopolyspora flava]|uniref:S-adenosyl methyltransferase n=1 Tax=Saccharopolyspora flava TaxID=95161 RepID=A0A1I6U4L6_9PSEU|nr:S-adenosyl methyltransferase [Saccharopolyspora flava]